MSAQRRLQSLPATTQQSERPLDGPRAPQDLSAYPVSLDAHDMAAIFRKSLKRFYALDADGAFLFAENRPRIGKKSWSRDRVRAYFAGELTGLTVARKRA